MVVCRQQNNPCWLWHAIDHYTGKVLAYVFGGRKDEVFSVLLLEPFGLTRYYTDYWGAYTSPSTRRALPRQTQRKKSSASI